MKVVVKLISQGRPDLGCVEEYVRILWRELERNLVGVCGASELLFKGDGQECSLAGMLGDSEEDSCSAKLTKY